MRLATWSGAALALALALASGCGSKAVHNQEMSAVGAPATPAGAAALKPFFIAGEQFEYRIALHSVEGARMVLAAGNPGVMEGRPVLILASRVETVGLGAALGDRSEELITTLDLTEGRPIAHRALTKIGDRSESIETQFGAGSFQVTRVGKLGTRVERRVSAPGVHTYNLPSSLLALRGWQAERGAEVELFVMAQSRIWRTRVRSGESEMVETEVGKHRARRLDGVAVRLTPLGEPEPDGERRFSLWISDDGQRIPVRMVTGSSFGPAELVLASYQKN